MRPILVFPLYREGPSHCHAFSHVIPLCYGAYSPYIVPSYSGYVPHERLKCRTPIDGSEL